MDVDVIGQPKQPGGGKNDIIGWREAGTLWGLFCERVRRSPHAIAYREYDPSGGKWCAYTWRSIASRVDRLRSAFAGEGLAPGEHVAVLLPNGIDWVSFDLAAHGSGLVVVGLYARDTSASNAAILGHSDARLVFLDTDGRWQSLVAFSSKFPLLRCVWIRGVEGNYTSAATGLAERRLADILADKSSPPSPQPGEPDDVATLIYTSGTTGPRKSVMLSQFALLWNAATPGEVIPPHPNDVFLSILPLAHAFARTTDLYLAMMGGCTVAYARSPKELRQDLITIRPTVLFGVPFLFERLAAAISTAGGARFAKRRLLQLSAFLGLRLFQMSRHRGSLGLAARLLSPLFNRFVAGRVLAAFGGRLRVAISGGAPLDPKIARLLVGLGVPLVEGYGLTEAGPSVCLNRFHDNLPGSVGRPLPGVEVKVTPQNELLVHSPSMMKGYWKDDAETARVLDHHGWLSTGDLAEIKDGRIFIRGRLKDMIVLSIGEKINPTVIETEIARDPLFDQVMVIGDRRPYLAALLVLDGFHWNRFAEDNGIAPEKPNQASGKGAVPARLKLRLSHLPSFAHIHAVHLALTPWTIEAGLLTPTLKINRDALQLEFAKEIEALYAEQ
jgi:long-chain acyl-CoA synthetase